MKDLWYQWYACIVSTVILNKIISIWQSAKVEFKRTFCKMKSTYMPYLLLISCMLVAVLQTGLSSAAHSEVLTAQTRYTTSIATRLFCFALLCFALLCFALLCFALLCCALLTLYLSRCVCASHVLNAMQLMHEEHECASRKKG